MAPPRIKHWGFWPVTRRAYLINQIIVLVAWLFLLGVYWRLPSPLPEPPRDSGDVGRWLFAILPSIFWVLIVVAVWWPIDLYFTLRAFARADQQPPAPPRV